MLIEKGMRIDEVPDESQLFFDPITGPLGQWYMWGIPQPYDWQLAVLDACWGARNVAVRTCNESGKTQLVVPLLAMSWAAAFKGSKVIITSASEAQIKLQLWPSIQRMARSKGYQYNQSQVTLPRVDPEIDGSTITIRVTKSGERFEGFHNTLYKDSEGRDIFGPLLMIYDEAKSISQDIFDAGTRCNPVASLRISTTGEDLGGFYDACMNMDKLWITDWEFNGRNYEFKIPWTMCPHLCKPGSKTMKEKQAILDARGVDDPYVASMLLAEFFRSGTYMAFEDTDLLAAKRCMSNLVQSVPGRRVAFCDLSGGGDELTLGIRDGNHVLPFVTWKRDQKVAPSIEAQKYVKLFQDFHLKPQDIYADNGGYGASIIREIHRKGWPINPVNANQKPHNESAYRDRYAELHWELKDLLQTSKIKIPKDEILLEQMRKRKYIRPNSDHNRIAMQSKEEARKKDKNKSPDRLDTLIYLIEGMERMPDPRIYNPNSICGTVSEYQEWAKKQEDEHSARNRTMMRPW